MNEDPLAQALASTDFEPEDLELADLFLGYELAPTVAAGTPAMISTGLNSADLAYVFLSIDPPGAPMVASEWEDPRLTRSVWLDLRPAEALELGTRLRICAEAAAQFAEACAAGPDGADGEDDQAVGPVMDPYSGRAALEIGDETEPAAISGTEGVHTMTIESSTDKSMKASDVRFFWIQDEGLQEDLTYHWAADCAWVAVAVWRGGRLVSSEAPPPGAADTAWVRKTLEEHLPGPAWHAEVVDSPTAETVQARWLCAACSNYLPRPEAVPLPADSEPCKKCGCRREIHIHCRGPFDRGCGMAWSDADYDEDGQVMGGRLLHCPCTGYEPPAGGRPLTPSDLAAGELSWRGD